MSGGKTREREAKGWGDQLAGVLRSGSKRIGHSRGFLWVWPHGRQGEHWSSRSHRMC